MILTGKMDRGTCSENCPFPFRFPRIPSEAIFLFFELVMGRIITGPDCSRSVLPRSVTVSSGVAVCGRRIMEIGIKKRNGMRKKRVIDGSSSVCSSRGKLGHSLEHL